MPYPIVAVLAVCVAFVVAVALYSLSVCFVVVILDLTIARVLVKCFDFVN